MRILWLTDLHLDFIDEPRFFQLIEGIDEAHADALIITGDIATAATWPVWIARLKAHARVPFWFVLGNHDFYGASIAETREVASAIAGWLTGAGVIGLTADAALIGHDGWYDAVGAEHPLRFGMRDWQVIRDFACADLEQIKRVSLGLAMEAAMCLCQRTVEAFDLGYKHVVVATHVPPFREASYHLGQLSPAHSMPFFSAGVIGEGLLEVASAWPDRRITVLSGHTHAAATLEVAPNLLVRVGAAEYGDPCVAGIVEVA